MWKHPRIWLTGLAIFTATACGSGLASTESTGTADKWHQLPDTSYERRQQVPTLEGEVLASSINLRVGAEDICRLRPAAVERRFGELDMDGAPEPPKPLPEWKPCPGTLPVGEQVFVRVEHEDGRRTPLGSVPVSADGQMSVALATAGNGFEIRGPGSVVATLGRQTVDLGCGLWESCRGAKQCSEISRRLPGYRTEIAQRLARWIDAERGQDAGLGAGAGKAVDGRFSSLVDRIATMTDTIVEGSVACSKSERARLVGTWRDTLAMPKIGGSALTLKLLAQWKNDASAEVTWRSGSDEFHGANEGWLGSIRHLIDAQLARVGENCDGEKVRFIVERKANRWARLADQADIALGRCEGSNAEAEIRDVRRWALGVECSASHDYPTCQRACEAGDRAACKESDRAAVALKRKEAAQEAAAKRQAAADEAESTKAATLSNAKFIAELDKVCRVLASPACLRSAASACHRGNPYASGQYCTEVAREQVSNTVLRCAIVLRGVRQGMAAPKVDLGLYKLMPCSF